MTRAEMKYTIWLWMRRKRLCEDDRCPELAAKWNATMARFLESRAA